MINSLTTPLNCKITWAFLNTTDWLSLKFQMGYMVKIHISAFVQIVKCPYFFFRKNKSYVFALSLQYRVPANKKDNSFNDFICLNVILPPLRGCKIKLFHDPTVFDIQYRPLQNNICRQNREKIINWRYEQHKKKIL
jgi:hypothetical protein